MRYFGKKLMVGICLVAGIASARQPNIVFILCDDLGYGDLGITGHPYAKSPNIDQLARDGIRFEQFYTAGTWCAPSRAGFMGGMFPARDFTYGGHTLNVERPSVTRVLKEAGYATAHFGKWHIGKNEGDPPPADYGIDESLTTQSTGPTWPTEARKDPHYREKTTPHYIDLAVDFIERKKDQPFFINLWLYPTHSYINPTEEQLAVYKDLKVEINDFENPLQREFLEFVSEHGDVQDAMRAYCADVTALDGEVGRLLSRLSDMNLAENTIVIFSSDNGPGPLCGNWDSIVKRYKQLPLLLNNVGSSGPYRDRKSSIHEGGIHAPFFVRWPEKIKAGGIDENTVIGGVDLLPTLAQISGAEIPNGLDGETMAAAWAGKPVVRETPLYFNDRPGWSALREKQWKAHWKKGMLLLFDVMKDPSESENVAKEFPELSEKYMKQLKQWEASIPIAVKK
jgi:arylsulfatase A-like enzyme